MCEPEHTFLMIQKTIESKVNKAAQGTAYKKGGRVSFCLYVGRTMPHSGINCLIQNPKCTNSTKSIRLLMGFYI